MEDLAEGCEVEAFNVAENALLSAVGRVLRREKISGIEVQKLRDLGWKDSDILDACAQGTDLISSSCLFAAFRPRFSYAWSTRSAIP